MDVEALHLEAGKTVGVDLEPFADGIEMIESFPQTEVAQVVRTELIAQETGKLFVLFKEGMFSVRSENVMPVFDLSIWSG